MIDWKMDVICGKTADGNIPKNPHLIVSSSTSSERNEVAGKMTSPVICFIEENVNVDQIDWVDLHTLCMMDGIGMALPCMEKKDRTFVFSCNGNPDIRVIACRRDIFEQADGFNPSLPPHEASERLLQAFLDADVSVVRHGFSSVPKAGCRPVAEALARRLETQRKWWIERNAGERKELIAIIPFYNFCNQNILVENHLRHVEVLRQQKVEFLTVELGLEGKPFTLPECGPRIQLRTKSLMWQKEALINHGARQVPHRYISWHDSGTELDSDWVEKTIAMLKTCDIVQCFSRSLWYKNDGKKEDWIADGIVKSWLSTKKDGNPASGGIWAARRRFFDEVGMYPYSIVGGGDALFASLMNVDLKWEEERFCVMTDKHKEHFDEWYSRMRKLNLEFGYVPGKWKHWWHGPLLKRRYLERHVILFDNLFDPVKDLKMVNGVIEWNSDKKQLHESIGEYFKSRK